MFFRMLTLPALPKWTKQKWTLPLVARSAWMFSSSLVRPMSCMVASCEATSHESAKPRGPTLNQVKTMMENTRWALVREKMLSPKSLRPSKMANVVAAAIKAERARKQRKMNRLSLFVRDASASAMVSAKLKACALANLCAKLVHLRRQGRLNAAESKTLLAELEVLRWPAKNQRQGLSSERYLVLPSNIKSDAYGSLRALCAELMAWADPAYR